MAPTGNMLTDGFSTIISCTYNPSVKFWEMEVDPPGVEGGGGKKVTTMRATAWHQKAPNVLKDLTDAGAKVGYDPAVLADIYALINVNTQWTITYPDGATEVFTGWLDSFKRGTMVEGEVPTADIVIIPSNRNGSGTETAPTATAGTTTTTTTPAP